MSHLDAVFGQDDPVPSAITTPLHASIDELANSLGVKPHAETGRYEPDALVAAIHAVHAKLRGVHARLTERAQQLNERERAIAEKEASLMARERRLRAFDQLAPLVGFDGLDAAPDPAQPRRRWFS